MRGRPDSPGEPGGRQRQRAGTAFLGQLLLCLVMFSLTGCERTDANAPVAVDPDLRDLAIVVSGDTQGWIMPCGCTSNQSGGLARRATFLRNLAGTHEVLALDVGGAAESAAPYQLERFRAILRGELLMGVKAHNLGASELALGATALRELTRETGTSFLSSNVRTETGDPVAKSHLLIEIGGRKVLVAGVVSPQFPPGEGLQVSAPAAAILAVLEQVNQRFDSLIVLAYVPAAELQQLGESLPEADAVVGGPTGQAVAPLKLGRTLLLSATNKGKFLAKLTRPGVSSNSALAGELVELTPDFPDDPSQLTNLHKFRALLEQRDFPAAQSGLLGRFHWSPADDQRFAGSESCRSCHAKAFDTWGKSGHGHAWERLRGEGAHVDSYCQQCHVTGFGLPGGFVSAKLSADRVDVGCENCHGPSQAHVQRSEVRTPVAASGTCVLCHDHENSPAFDFASYWERIKHD